jgi:hypothetical protein
MKAQHYARDLGNKLNKAENQAMWRQVDDMYSQEDKESDNRPDPKNMSLDQLQAELKSLESE